MVDIVMPSPCTAPSQAISVKAFRWRTRSDHGTRKALLPRGIMRPTDKATADSRSVLSFAITQTSPGKFGRTMSGVYVPSSFGTVVWVLLHPTTKNQISESAVRQDLRFFVLIRED